MKKITDRRTQRTRHRLQSTLHSLLQRHDYEAISVDQICRHSRVGRSTFYTHFKSKDDLKRSALDHLSEELHMAQAAASARQPFAFTRTLFEHGQRHLRDYRALIHGRGGRVALTRIKQILTHLVRQELVTLSASSHNVRDDGDIDFKVVYIVGALIALLTQWLSEGARADVDTMAKLFAEMTQGALAGR